jgi:hypothetical protein
MKHKGLIAFINDGARKDKWTEIDAKIEGLDEFLNKVGAYVKKENEFWWNGRLFTFRPEEYTKFGIKVKLRKTPWGKMPSVETPMFNEMLENL